MPKFKVGDSVMVVNYGSLMWIRKEIYDQMGMNTPIYKKDEDIYWLDLDRWLIGKIGVVEKVTNTQGRPRYSLDGIPEKCAWYDEKQLELT